MHRCEHVGTKYVRMAQNINPGIQRGPPIGAPPKPNEVGLVGRGGAAERLSFCPERQNEGCGACDDEARLSPLSFAVQRKMGPPEVVGLAEQSAKNEKKKKASREPLTAGPFSLPFESSALAPGTSSGQRSHKFRTPYPPNKPPPPLGSVAAGDSGGTYDAR